MTAEEARRRLTEALATGRLEITRHFFDELREDVFYFSDVRHAIDALENVLSLGEDQAGNPKFEVTGPAVDGRALSLICSFKSSGAVLCIAVYEGER